MCSYATSNELHGQMPEDVREKLASTFVKIATARWFDRAWCLHEFLVGRNHVFLVPIWRVGSPAHSDSSSTSIMRIDGPLLVRMYQIFIEQDIKHQKTNLDSLLNSRKFTGTKIDNIRLFFNRLRRLELQEVCGSQERLVGDGSFMHMFYEVFSHNSMYNTDKISIILNAMRSGLYLKTSTPFSEDECLWLITLVAMAAGDSTALTTNGSRAIGGEGPFRKNRCWIRTPSAEDQARRTGAFTIPRTAIDARVLKMV